MEIFIEFLSQNPWSIFTLLAVVALGEIIKLAQPRFRTNRLPLVLLPLSIALSIAFGGINAFSVVIGIVVALVSYGGYDVIKAFFIVLKGGKDA